MYVMQIWSLFKHCNFHTWTDEVKYYAKKFIIIILSKIYMVVLILLWCSSCTACLKIFLMQLLLHHCKLNLLYSKWPESREYDDSDKRSLEWDWLNFFQRHWNCNFSLSWIFRSHLKYAAKELYDMYYKLSSHFIA